jgi:AcrR family transcriptional regulator
VAKKTSRTTGRATAGTGPATARRASRSAGRRQVVSHAERRAATRRAVLDAAAECFNESGYLRTTLDDVTSRASLTKGAVYFHFGSKEALATAVIDEQADYWPPLIQELTSRPGSPLDHLINLSYEVNRALRDNVAVRAGFRLSIDPDLPNADPAHTVDVWTDRVGELLRKARRAGVLADDVSPAVASRVVVAGVLGSFHLAAAVDDVRDARKRLDEYWSVMLPRLAR